jgi:hypothetical protein
MTLGDVTHSGVDTKKSTNKKTGGVKNKACKTRRTSGMIREAGGSVRKS